MTTVRFLFDFIPPYAYLAATQIEDLASRHERTVEWVPVLFAALLDHHGQKGPAEMEAKRRYVFKNVLRLATDFDVPVAAPCAHPFNPLLALRVASAAEPGVRARVVRRLFEAVWVRGENVTDPDTVRGVLDELGLDGPSLLAAATSAEGKQAVRAQTEAAINSGVFGVPTMDVDGELFWGVDALPHVDRFLRGDDPVAPDLERAWATLKPQAVRPGSRS